MRSVISINSLISMGDQPSEEHIALLRRHGFRSVLNLSGGTFPWEDRHLSPAIEGELLRQSGLHYEWLPMSLSTLSEEKIDALCFTLKQIPKPTFVHGRVGKEALVLAILEIALSQDLSFEPSFIRAADDEAYDDPRLPDYVRRFVETLHRRRTLSEHFLPPFST